MVVVQKRERNIQKKCDARAQLLFCLLNLLFLWRSRCRPRRWILKSLMRKNAVQLGNLHYQDNNITILNKNKRYIETFKVHNI